MWLAVLTPTTSHRYINLLIITLPAPFVFGSIQVHKINLNEDKRIQSCVKFKHYKFNNNNNKMKNYISPKKIL